MRSALALSALLLLLPPSPALSQDDVVQSQSQDNSTATPTSNQNSSIQKPTTMATMAPTSSSSTTVSVPVLESGTKASTTPKMTSAAAQQNFTTLSSSLGKKPTGDSPTTASGTEVNSSTHPASSVASTSPATTGPQSGDKASTLSGDQSNGPVATKPMTTQGGDQLTTQAATSAPHVFITTSPHPSTNVTSEAPESPPEGQSGSVMETTSSSPTSSLDLTPTMQEMFTSHTLPGTSQGPQQPFSQMPPSPEPSISVALQPTSSAARTQATPAFWEPTGLNTKLAPTAPQGFSTPSPTWTVGKNKVKCDPAVKPSDDLLILNFTTASFCAGSPPDDKLVSLLCQSVKANFNPAQDECTITLACVLESQAVAVKGITIETKLLPKDVYERLRDKWDVLKEAGVSDMQLGNDSPIDDEDHLSIPLIITIVCMACFLLLVAALYGCCHQRLSQRKDQQRLTEELQTVENGYHDNPTLEVMETTSEMQEKKVVNLNGELGDSWIVPLDNLTKDDFDEEEDTHL
ncbi:podocalyxin-like [Dipodomys spectabilis]|uniref:podocalyxin-like n=1 Tax=Dipodomys spectabilis TaxID=105255 RepID=UPI001C538B54|nr:podocalyxin-like [Dipodomys spectabilis]